MTDAEFVELVTKQLFAIAPEFEGEEIDPEASFRDQFEIDSMDFLNFIIAVHHATKIDIPEEDYSKMETLNGCVSYLKEKCG